MEKCALRVNDRRVLCERCQDDVKNDVEGKIPFWLLLAILFFPMGAPILVLLLRYMQYITL